MKYLIISLSAAGLFVACANPRVESKDVLASNTSIQLSNFDTTVVPGDNFFEYVNGNWLKKNPIPSTESSWNNFNVIRDNNISNLRNLFEEAAKGPGEAGTPKQKVGDFYATAMDSVKLQKDGFEPLNEELNLINEIKTPQDLARIIAHQQSVGVKTLFEFNIGPDPKISTENIVTLTQGGIGLPDMDYYLNKENSIQEIRKQYIDHVKSMFSLMKMDEKDVDAAVKAVMNIETKLAAVSMNRVELRNVAAQYNKKTKEEFTASSRNFDWNTYFKEIGIEAKVKELIVAQPKFFAGVNGLVKSVSLEEWKNYLRWNLINYTGAKLSDDFVKEDFHFFGTVLNGTQSLKPRWMRVVPQTDNSLNDLAGQLFVEKYFSSESKKKVNEMVDNLTASYKERINSREWMGPETKKQALHKLETIARKLAFPDKWRDYTALEIKHDSYVSNFLRSNHFEFNYMLNKLGKPVDKTEWGMTAPTVNAYYNPSYNEIVFPAGIMQSPFFDAKADDAVNYGAMGAIIGHELTHGFDDQGCQYDADGNMKNWWTKEDSLRFKKLTNTLVDEFNKFAALDTFHINGQLTLGENIADLGGLTIAYYAYKKHLEGKPVPEKINGLTGEQRFFISWAQSWRGSMRPEYLKELLKTNPHSPTTARVMVPLSNMKEFYEAFQVKPGNAMYRPESERAEIW